MFAMDILNNWLLSFYNPNKGKITLQQKLTLPFPLSFPYLVVVNKLLPRTFSNDSWRVMVGYPSIRTLLPSLLVSLKKSLALLFVTNLFFSISPFPYLIVSDSLLRLSVPQTHVCAPDNCYVCVGLPIPDIYRCTAQFVINWEWVFLPNM